MGRPPKSTEGMTPEEIKKRQRQASYLAKYKENHPDWRKKHKDLIETTKADKFANELSESLGLSKDHAPEVFNPERISVEDYERCEAFLLRWMIENFSGVRLPDDVQKRLNSLQTCLDRYLYIDDTRGFMKIIMT